MFIYKKNVEAVMLRISTLIDAAQNAKELTAPLQNDILKISNHKASKSEKCSGSNCVSISATRQRNWRNPHNRQTSG